MKQNHAKHVYFSFFNPLKVTGELEIESLGWVYWGELGGGACHRAKPVSFVLNTPPFEVPWNSWLHGYAVISREHLRTRNTGHTCLVLATQLPGYAVVNTSPPPWNMLVGKKVATKLRSSQYLPSPLKKVAKLRGYAVVNTSPPPWNVLVGEKWLCGYGRYAVVKPTPPSQNMLVRKEVAMRLRSLGFLCNHTFQDLFWSRGVFSS